MEAVRLFVLVSSLSMSARRKHVRAHARDVEVEVDLENGDRVCRVEEIKGGNVIEVNKHINPFSSSVRVCNDFFVVVVAFVFGRFRVLHQL